MSKTVCVVMRSMPSSPIFTVQPIGGATGFNLPQISPADPKLLVILAILPCEQRTDSGTGSAVRD